MKINFQNKIEKSAAKLNDLDGPTVNTVYPSHVGYCVMYFIIIYNGSRAIHYKY